MAVATTGNKIFRYGDDNNTVWPFPYPVPEARDIKVIVTPPGVGDQYISSNLFQVDGIGTGAITVTYPLSGEPLPMGWKITILRELELLSDFDPDNGAGLNAEEVTFELDRHLMMIQELSERTGRSLQWPITMNPGDMESPGEYLAQVNAARDVAVNAAGAAGGSANEAEWQANEARMAAESLAGLLPQESGEAGDVLSIGAGGTAVWEALADVQLNDGTTAGERGQIGQLPIQAAGLDLDDFKSSGNYYFPGTATPLNSPSPTGAAITVEVRIETNQVAGYQLVRSMGPDSEIHFRNLANATWQPWHRVDTGYLGGRFMPMPTTEVGAVGQIWGGRHLQYLPAGGTWFGWGMLPADDSDHFGAAAPFILAGGSRLPYVSGYGMDGFAIRIA